MTKLQGAGRPSVRVHIFVSCSDKQLSEANILDSENKKKERKTKIPQLVLFCIVVYRNMYGCLGLYNSLCALASAVDMFLVLGVLERLVA